MIDIRLMRRTSLVGKSRRAETRRRRGCFKVEALEGRTLLSLTLQTHPIPETAGSGIAQIVPGPDGNLWFTAVLDQAIDPLNPAPPAGVVGVMTPTGASEDLFPPNGLRPWGDHGRSGRQRLVRRYDGHADIAAPSWLRVGHVHVHELPRPDHARGGHDLLRAAKLAPDLPH